MKVPLLVLQATKAGQRPGNEVLQVQHDGNNEAISRQLQLLKFWREHVLDPIASVVAT